MYKRLVLALIVLAMVGLCGCATTPPPKKVDNICSIFKQYPKWYWATQDVQKKWGVPISVVMAVIHQESRFNSKIKPPRGRILWVIPWSRPTSAYGYAQVLDSTWREYQRSTGNTSANRDNFYDAIDFIGWYTNQGHRRIGLPKGDPYKVYLAYHEGIGGYSRGTYKRKQWLINVANKVKRNAWAYHNQLMRCQRSLPKRPWWHFWSYV